MIIVFFFLNSEFMEYVGRKCGREGQPSNEGSNTRRPNLVEQRSYSFAILFGSEGVCHPSSMIEEGSNLCA